MAQVQRDLHEIILNNTPDSWSYIWNFRTFFSKKGLQALKWSLILHLAFNWNRKSSCQNKHKVFFWLLLKERLSTRDLLKRKNMTLQGYNCPLCNGSAEETLIHMFIHCTFTTQCWAWLKFRWTIVSVPSKLYKVLKINYMCLSSWKSSF